MIIQRALDIAVPDKNMRLLFSLVAALIAIYVVSVIFTTIRSRIMVDVSQNIIYDIRRTCLNICRNFRFSITTTDRMERF